MAMLRLLLLLAVSARVVTAILEDVRKADLEIVRIRLEEEKARRLLLQNDVEVLMVQVEDLRRKSDERDKQAVHGNVSLDSHGIAFTAILTSHTTFVPNQTVVFDHIKVNEGNCYDSSTGRFKAPTRGLYSFSLTVLAHNNQMVHSFIMKDKDEIGRVFSGTSGTSSGSVTVVAIMNKGQVVYVKAHPSLTQTMHADWTIFTGLRLDQYD